MSDATAYKGLTDEPRSLMDGDGRLPGDLAVRFETRTPDETQARANMAQNEQRGLPEAAPLKTVVIVANGPSARDGALWARLKREPATVTVALNGALKHFLAHDLKPTYWCACDPQALVADFIPDDPPPRVKYLVASKCHPAVFDKLWGRDVRIWRLDDFSREKGRVFVPCAVSITLVTQGLFRFLGFGRFEMYGWDCCFLDGEHHAMPQDHGEPEIIPMNLLTPEGKILKTHQTTGTWMAECSDAAIQASNFKALGLEMIVHGPGMVGEILRGRGLI